LSYGDFGDRKNEKSYAIEIGQYGLSTQVKTRKFALGDPKNTSKTGEPSF
jgi:hypothetical protein